MKKRVLFALLISSFANLLFGQQTDREIELIADSTFMQTGEDAQLFSEVSNLDPQRAALLSAVFPGLGQIYNKQYWKVPIIYVGFAAFGHFINYNNELYHTFRNAAISQSNNLENPLASVASTQNILIRNRDNFRRNRDYLIILGSVFYILNIVDAHVSAHLDEFNVNEDLSFSIEPSMQNSVMNSKAFGASLILHF
jgi:hypothetical protein